jgi:hypothetical protein
MPGDRPETAGSRGPVRREPSLSPSGYRISERRRFELQAASLYTGAAGLQGTIDLAVSEFLDRMHTEPGFSETLDQAERSQQRRAGVRQLPGTTP